MPNRENMIQNMQTFVISENIINGLGLFKREIEFDIALTSYHKEALGEIWLQTVAYCTHDCNLSPASYTLYAAFL